MKNTSFTGCLIAQGTHAENQSNMTIISHTILMSKLQFKWTYGLFGNNYSVATLSPLYPTVLDIDCLVFCNLPAMDQ